MEVHNLIKMDKPYLFTYIGSLLFLILTICTLTIEPFNYIFAISCGTLINISARLHFA